MLLGECTGEKNLLHSIVFIKGGPDGKGLRNCSNEKKRKRKVIVRKGGIHKVNAEVKAKFGSEFSSFLTIFVVELYVIHLSSHILVQLL